MTSRVHVKRRIASDDETKNLAGQVLTHNYAQFKEFSFTKQKLDLTRTMIEF